MTDFMNSARESQTSAQTMASADLTRSGSRQQIDRLLDEAMSMFHRDGPLVNPLERCASTSSMEMRMRFVCEAKGFDYGLFWEFDEDKKSLTCVSRVCIPDASGISLFVDTSFTMFKRFSMGLGCQEGLATPETTSGTKTFASCRRGASNASVKPSKPTFEPSSVSHWTMASSSLVHDPSLIIMSPACSTSKSFAKCPRSERLFHLSAFVPYVSWLPQHPISTFILTRKALTIA